MSTLTDPDIDDAVELGAVMLTSPGGMSLGLNTGGTPGEDLGGSGSVGITGAGSCGAKLAGGCDAPGVNTGGVGDS